MLGDALVALHREYIDLKADRRDCQRAIRVTHTGLSVSGPSAVSAVFWLCSPAESRQSVRSLRVNQAVLGMCVYAQSSARSSLAARPQAAA